MLYWIIAVVLIVGGLLSGFFAYGVAVSYDATEPGWVGTLIWGSIGSVGLGVLIAVYLIVVSMVHWLAKN